MIKSIQSNCELQCSCRWMEIQQQIILSWVHPYVTLPDLTHFAAAFLDLLLLASGLQSSARPFAWTPHHLRKALAWAAHLERVSIKLVT